MSRVYIIMSHYVRPISGSRYPAIKGLETSSFIEQIDYLSGNGFHFIRMEELIAAYTENAGLPEKAVLLTFDDGYSDHYSQVFPVLDERGIQGAFFIPGEILEKRVLLPVNKIHFILASVQNHISLKNELLELLNKYRGTEFDVPENEYLINLYEKPGRYDSAETAFIKKLLQTALPERLRDIIADELFKTYVGISKEALAAELYINRQQVSLMKRNGMFIGAHGYHHYRLANMELKEMRSDIEKGLDCLDEWIDRDSWVMNYPYGSFNSEVEDTIRSLGAKMAITTEVALCDTKLYDAFHVPRLNTNDYPPISDNYLKFS